MDLERRVQVLEQEVEILKNQVQETLLDIQEKVLTQTYPSLRAEDNVTSNHQDEWSGGRQRQEDYANNDIPVRQVHANQIQAKPPESISQPVNQHRQKVVSLEAFSGGHRQNGANALQSDPVENVDWERLESLEQWTLNKIERIGVNKTYKLLKSYLEQGRIDRNTFDALVAVVKLYAKPKKKKSAQSSQKSAQRKPTQQAQPRPRPQSKPAPPEEEGDGKHNLILRLIAGVSNASVGMSKGKKNG